MAESGGFAPTDEQLRAMDRARLSANSMMLSAYAGCAKSTTLELMAKEIRAPSLALAFNKKIAMELAPRFPQNFKVQTLNGLGHGAWLRRKGASGKLILDERKTGKLVSELAKETKTKLSSEQWFWTRDLVSGAMAVGLVPMNTRGAEEAEPLVEDCPDSWTSICEDKGIPQDDQILCVDLAREVLRRNIELALQGIISFDDQIYCPIVLGGFWPQYPLVMVDESQDLSPMNHEMLKKVIRPGGRLISVGDSRQAIYAFRGADAESMKNLRALAKSWDDLPLTLTFRCPKSIVQRQLDHAPGFRAAESNRIGRLLAPEPMEPQVEGSGWSYKWLVEKAQQTGEKPSIAILCRNNGPLFSLAFKLLRQGTGVQMLGRDIGKNLIQLSRKLCPDDETPARECAIRVCEWAERESELARINGKERLSDSINDRKECLMAVLENAQARDAGSLRSLLENLFSRDSGLVTLSSIHRAKGLEWDFVIHLDPWRIPSKWAKRAAAGGDERELIQEYNLRYVAETRTRDTLVLANLADFN